jgi:spermidine/putrescine transport system ATP-binding protein
MNIEINDVAIGYGEKTIVEKINFQVEQGEIFTLLGKSGIGKSTILRGIAGLIDLDEGHIFINGKNVTNLPLDQRNIAMVFQKPLLFPHLNVYDNIAFGLKMHNWKKNDIEERVTELLQLFQISELKTRMPSEISGGQQQRTAIARALALKHRILLMDEPFSSLDPYLKEEMYMMLDDIRKKLGLAIIFVTHDVKEALVLSDRIGYMAGGGIMQQGSSNDLYNYPSSRELAEFMGPANWLEGNIDLPGGRKLKEGKGQMLLRPHDLKIVKEDNISDEKDELMFSEPFKVLSSERKGNETTTVVSLKDKEIRVIQHDDMDFVKGENVYMKIVNPYMHVV